MNTSSPESGPMAVCPSCHETNPEAGAKCPRCPDFYYVPEDSVEEAESDPIIGTIAADKYVILGLISEGGMGAVYRALQMPVEREVAFKVLRTELKDSDNGRDRFIREARAVSRLNHPNIITLYDFGFEDGKHPYMVMEYAPGKSLSGWLKAGNITVESILRITAQILGALNEAHSHGIVHRDLKPENMIVSPKGNDNDRIKLLDFGIARMVNEGSTRGLTREGEVFGTPHYMAPEQAQGKKDIGPPADIYAVGIMMWEMICGRCPYDAPTPLAVLFMHINDPLPPLEPRPTVNADPQLMQILEKATAKNPVDRYQTASEMMADISQLIVNITGAHPSMLVGEVSQEFSLSSSDITPPPAGLSPGREHRPTPLPSRAPHFTPGSGEIGANVDVYDPDHSGLSQKPASEALDGESGNKKLGAVAIVAVVALVAVFGVFVTVLMSSDDPDAAETPNNTIATTDTQETNAGTEVAVQEPFDDVVVEPIEQLVQSETNGSQTNGAQTNGGDTNGIGAADTDKTEVAEIEKPKPRPKTKTTRKKSTKKTATVKAEPTEPRTKPKKTTKESSTDPAPAKWNVKPAKWK